MDIAIYTENEQTYYVEEFSHLPSKELLYKRQLLECPECRGPAYFRKASRSGQAACFGARPHKEGCGLAAFDNLHIIDDGQGEDREPFENSGETIVIDLNYAAESEAKVSKIDGSPSNHRRLARSFGVEPNAITKIQRRLSSLLRNLSESPYFRDSNQTLEIEGYPDMAAKDFFLSIEQITNEDVGDFRGCWGMLSCANIKPQGSLWLNGSGQKTINFCLDNELITPLFGKYGIEDEEELSGADILVLGVPKLSFNDTLYCRIEDLNHVALRLAK